MLKRTHIPPLPKLMVAPTGARRTKADHPALPITLAETVQTARACHAAGADGLHAHIRNDAGKHSLDIGLYRELLAELAITLPDFYVQITTEAVGTYSPQEQRDVVLGTDPAAVSISVREMLSEGETDAISDFYHQMVENKTAVQHILYSPEDIILLSDLCARAVIPAAPLQILLVLGRYSAGQVSHPDDLLPFLKPKEELEKITGAPADWACCAFGAAEQACLLKAHTLGGKARIGFENNLLDQNGKLAKDNAAQISTYLEALNQND